MSQADESDDVITLSAEASAALQDFYAERDQRERRFEDLRARAEAGDEDDRPLVSIDTFTEDWNASQFWYDESTARTLAEQLLDGADHQSRIAVVSAPSVFVQLKKIVASVDSSVKPEIWLFEFDRRFEVFSEFVPYDFNRPLQLPERHRGQFDRIICDPPFLSDDCQTKAALTVRWLSTSDPTPTRPEPDHNSAAPSPSPSPRPLRLITCTAETMGALVSKLHREVGVKRTDYRPCHANALRNEFCCYANFECAAWRWESS